MPSITYDPFYKDFLERFMPCNFKDHICDEFDHLEKVSITIVMYEAHFYALSRHLVTNISIELGSIHKFVKGLEGPYQLATT